jgi:hypothetical protein
MGICTKCGVIFNDEDYDEGKRHKCRKKDIPKKNKMKRLTYIEEDFK